MMRHWNPHQYKNYFLGTNDTIEMRGSAVLNLSNRSTDKNYLLIEFFCAKTIHNVSRCISDAALHSIRNGDTILLLSNTHEAFHDIVEPIYTEVIIPLGIPPMHVILLSESAIIDQEVKKVADKYNLPELCSEWCRIFEYNVALYSNTSVVTLEDKHYDKKFLNLNRRWRVHRPVFVALLKLHGLLDAGYVSLSNDVDTWEALWPGCIAHEPSLIPHKDEIFSIPSLTLDVEDLTVNQVDLTSSTDEYYANTYFSIVSETNFYDGRFPGLFLSEKVFKPIKMQHPFILLNRPHALAALRSVGYKTFDGIIDESYDREEDNQKRMMMVLAETKRLSMLAGNDLTIFLNKAREICKYNYDMLHSKTDWITQL